MTVFGIMVTGHDVEQAVIAHLEDWTLPYLAEIERQQGIKAESLKDVQTWTSTNEFRKWPNERFPVGVVIAPGLSDEPVKDGEGNYRGKFHVGIAIVVKGRKKDEVRENAQLYAAAVRGAILQHRSLGGIASGVEWLDEDYTDLPVEAERTLGSAQLVFEIELPNVIQVYGGLTELPDDPYDVPDAWPTVKEGGATVTVDQQEEEED